MRNMHEDVKFALNVSDDFEDSYLVEQSKPRGSKDIANIAQRLDKAIKRLGRTAKSGSQQDMATDLSSVITLVGVAIEDLGSISGNKKLKKWSRDLSAMGDRLIDEFDEPTPK